MNPESDEDQQDRINAEIRADATAARERATLPERTAAGAASNAVRGAGQRSSIAELARHEGPAFVEHAYRAILGRPPDTDGFARQMSMLGGGAGKVEVIGDLRYSEEGRRHNAPIAGLLPRYALAKLARVPLLGAIVQWIIAAASLPHLLRHQRATEASLAVRFGETAAALRAAEHRDADLRDAIEAQRSDLADAVAELSERLTRSELFATSLNGNVLELRQLALSMNHWTVQVRKSVDAIEAAEAERRARNDELSAAMILRARANDAERAPRLRAWADMLADRVPSGAVVLDLASGADWLIALSERGWRASAIAMNAALHRDARARNLDVTLGDPGALLARITDASLDALTVAAPEGLSDALPTAQLLREAQRILKRGGSLMIGVAGFHSRAEAAEMLGATGFTEANVLDAFGGNVMFAVRS